MIALLEKTMVNNQQNLTSYLNSNERNTALLTSKGTFIYPKLLWTCCDPS